MVQYLIGLVIGGVVGYFFCAWLVIGKLIPPDRANH